MLITRVAFDLLRTPSFRDAAAAYIQRKLDQLRYPAYIDRLKVLAAPHAGNPHAWPDSSMQYNHLLIKMSLQPLLCVAPAYHVLMCLLPGGGHLRGALSAGGE